MNSEFYADFKQCWEKIEEVGLLYATASAKFHQAQDSKPAVLAKIIWRIIKDNPTLSFAKAENQAKASDDYQAHIDETAELEESALSLQAQRDMWKAKFEGTRSLSSLEKVTQNQISH